MVKLFKYKMIADNDHTSLVSNFDFFSTSFIFIDDLFFSAAPFLAFFLISVASY
jgi:hypothetical protein